MREEEEESSESFKDTSGSDRGDDGHSIAVAPDANVTQRAVQELFENLCNRQAPLDESTPTSADSALDLLCNHAALLKARDSLVSQNQDKLAKSQIDVIFCARISAMIGVLNLFLDPELSYNWREASIVVAKA